MKKTWKRALAMVCTAAMVATGVNWPGMNANAAGTENAALAEVSSSILEENATANTEQWPAAWTNDGEAAWAFDTGTHWWHTRYQNWDKIGTGDPNDVLTSGQLFAQNADGTVNYPWIGSAFITENSSDAVVLKKITYLGRSNGNNWIGNYVLYAADVEEGVTPSDNDFIEVAKGTFETPSSNNLTTERVIELEKPVAATHFRLEARSKVGGGDKNITASKIKAYKYDGMKAAIVPQIATTVPEVGDEPKIVTDQAGEGYQMSAEWLQNGENVVNFAEGQTTLKIVLTAEEGYVFTANRLPKEIGLNDYKVPVEVSVSDDNTTLTISHTFRVGGDLCENTAEIVTESEELGIVSVSETEVLAGKSVTFTAVPNEKYYRFDGWYDNAEGTGDPVSTDAEYTVRVIANTALYAKFSVALVEGDDFGEGIYVSDGLDWISASNGYGSIGVNTRYVDGNDAPKITLYDGDTKNTYEKGIGVHAEASIVYNVTGKGFKYFTSDVGIDGARDEADEHSTVVFEVLTSMDNQTWTSAGRSPEMHAHDCTHVGTTTAAGDVIAAGTYHMEVNVDGANYIKLQVYKGADDKDWGDHADWADAKLYFNKNCSMNAAVVTGGEALGSVSVSETTVLTGNNVTFTATPNEKYYSFDGWYDNAEGTGDPISTNTEYTLVVSENLTLYAKFSESYLEDDFGKGVYVSDGLDWISASNGYGSIGINTRYVDSDGAPKITLYDGDTKNTYEKGIGVHAEAAIVYNVTGKGFKYFTSDVGIDGARSESTNHSTVVFEVLTSMDNQTWTSAGRSPEMHAHDCTHVGTTTAAGDVIAAGTYHMEVNVEGVNYIKLQVYKGSDNLNYGDHADWADAKLYFEKYLPADDAKIVSSSITLTGKIGLNFYAKVAEDKVNDAVMKLTLNGKTELYNVADLPTTTINGETYYVATQKLAAAQMTEEVTAELLVGDISVSTRTQTVKAYADKILAAPETYGENLVGLVKAMLHYGAYAQVQFDTNTDNLANKGLDSVTLDVSGMQAPEKSFEVTINGVKKPVSSATLVLDSGTSLRYILSQDLGDLAQYTFSINGKNVEVKSGSGNQYVEYEDIPAALLDETYTLTITKDTESVNVVYSPFNYIFDTLDRGGSTENLENVVKALYMYNAAANVYFNR